jgi:peptidyl-prolyl cis-trans isomerase D
MAKKPKTKIVTKKHLARVEREKIQNRNIMVSALAVLVVVLGIIIYGILDQTVLRESQPVAQVGSDVITTRQFEIKVRYTRFQLIQQYNQYAPLAAYFGQQVQDTLTQISNELSDTVTLGNNVLDQMIDDVMIRQEAKKRGITVSRAEVDTALQEGFAFFPNGTQTPTLTPTSAVTPTMDTTQVALVTITPTPTITSTPTTTATPAATSTPVGTATMTATTGPTDTITPTPTPYTQAGYKNSVKTFLDGVKSLGITENDLRWILETSLYDKKVQDAITADLKPEDQKVWARHILVADEATAQSIETRLKNGADFAVMAKLYSTDTSNNSNGGDLGWFTKGVMDTTFEKVAFAMKVGEISQPVHTQFGWHIIQCLGNQQMPLTDAEFTQYKQRTFTNWLTQSKTDRTDIKKYDIWSQRVPTEPLFTPQAATNP